MHGLIDLRLVFLVCEFPKVNKTLVVSLLVFFVLHLMDIASTISIFLFYNGNIVKG